MLRRDNVRQGLVRAFIVYWTTCKEKRLYGDVLIIIKIEMSRGLATHQ